ncbi:inositol 2-dehydrogenase [Aliiglaciecola lipolytica]|uniref:Myo-inositol 2-dehydrogenase protein n=1 Tax=Aliiglaciecola lipolytica E3 TaxID=1127673 RepID=K6Y6S3_9ALTE|nr:inositol 2-dehydrogenase [Aliiglaciecola lipolytica]GAC13917.1 myo-inositol 2-dehydrogenase protein [Aliiglaciecola lipolytica E3]
MINFALLGAGRIGKMHAALIAASPQARLSYVFDSHSPSAVALAESYGATVAESVDVILQDQSIDAILIATSTDTHVGFIIQAAKAGKAILCEKPIDLSTKLVTDCWQQIKDCNVPIQIGFNRRFDPTHATLQGKLTAGEIGELQQLIITSRDPDIAPAEYLRNSGGIFRDMIIHDFDMLRFITGEEITEVHAIGSTLIDPKLAQFGDVDSVMLTLKTASGKLCHINGSRRCVYGYDQRIEAFGANGMLQSTNPLPHSVSMSTPQNTASHSPLNPFFIERYQQAYQAQLSSFINCLINKTAPSPSFLDGLRAQQLADAAQQSLDTGLPVKLA